jgi:hypothetical protein
MDNRVSCTSNLLYERYICVDYFITDVSGSQLLRTSGVRAVVESAGGRGCEFGA